MPERLNHALLFAVPGVAVAAIALHGAVGLSAIFTRLKKETLAQDLPVPVFVALYFRNTVRVLFFAAIGFVLVGLADVVAARAGGGSTLALIFGYASGLLLLVCALALLLQSSVDRHLKLLPGRVRGMQFIAGVVGAAAACWGMMLVTQYSGIWQF